MAFADCSIQVLSNREPLLCDCVKIIEQDQVPMSADETNQQQKIAQHTDWKYTVLSAFNLSQPIVENTIQYNGFYLAKMPLDRATTIFHPPSC